MFSFYLSLLLDAVATLAREAHRQASQRDIATGRGDTSGNDYQQQHGRSIDGIDRHETGPAAAAAAATTAQQQARSATRTVENAASSNDGDQFSGPGNSPAGRQLVAAGNTSRDLLCRSTRRRGQAATVRGGNGPVQHHTGH